MEVVPGKLRAELGLEAQGRVKQRQRPAPPCMPRYENIQRSSELRAASSAFTLDPSDAPKQVEE